MRGFYALLVAVAVIGGGALWYSSRQRAAPAPAPSAPPPAAAADGFRGYTMGSDAARIEVTEYSDFECPFCAALAAQCGGEQGKFWEMHDQLFGHHEWAQTGKNPRSLFRDFAKTVGLDLDKYDACMDSQRYAGRIQTSVQEGEAAGVQGTPSFFVNGKRFTGRATSDAFKALADSLTHTRK